MVLKDNSRVNRASLIFMIIAIAGSFLKIIVSSIRRHIFNIWDIYVILTIGILVYIVIQLCLKSTKRALSGFLYYVIAIIAEIVLDALVYMPKNPADYYDISYFFSDIFSYLLPTVIEIFIYAPVIVGIILLKKRGSAKLLKVFSLLEAIFFGIFSIVFIFQPSIYGFISRINASMFLFFLLNDLCWWAVPLTFFYLSLFAFAKGIEQQPPTANTLFAVNDDFSNVIQQAYGNSQE